MMITIHGLPPMTTFQTVKALVRQECNIIDFIVDNLVDDGPNSKKVRIGLSDDAEGYLILKCLNGFRMSPSHVLKIVPVGKALNPPPHQNYDQRSGFPNQPRNEYPNQPRPDYQQNHSINEYENRGPQGPHGSIVSRPAIARPNTNMQRQHGLPEPRQPVPHRPEHRDAGPQGGPDPMHSQPWRPNPNVNSSNNQWAPHGQGSHMPSQDAYNQRSRQPGFVQQHPQRTQDPYPQGRGPPDQGYGQSKPSPNEPAPNRRNALRMVDIVENPRAPARPQEKPITIMKDNFQGPSQHLGPFSGPGQGPAPVWAQAGPKPQSYDDRRHLPLDKRSDISKQMPQDYEKRAHFSPPRNARPVSPPRDMPSNAGRNYQERGRRVSPQGRSFPIGDRRNSPTGRLGPPVRDFSPSGRRISPTGRKTSPPGRRVSPPGRRISSPGRRISPSGRRISPSGRRISPSGRRVSPPGRRISPSGRRISPNSRRISPNGRRISPPGRRISPSGRRISPNGRRISPPGRRISPSGRRISPPGRRISPPGRRISPSGRRISPPGRRISPPGRRISPSGRRISPSGRRISPPGRRISPSGRRISPPGRRISPSGRRISPSGRRISPPGRRISPPGRRISPTVRRVSPPGIRNSQSGGRISPPGRGMSPGRRLSPGRREEPRQMSPSESGIPRRERESPRLVSPPQRPIRFSPIRLGGKPADKFTDGKWLKPVRPAYDPSQAQNQTYTGGYRKNVHENVQYPPSRQEPQLLPWQVDQVMYPSNAKKDEERRDAARRHEKPADKSPERRSRSPPKERYRRHSPSPRSSRSPRRSWALEKRRSPAPREPPPPPMWPGQEPGDQPRKSRFGDEPPRPVWDGERRPTQDNLRVRTDLQLPEGKFTSRREDVARENRARDDFRRDDFRREEPRRDEKVFSDIDKDFQDIYQRAVELRKKTEERKSGERRREEERYRRDESPPRSRERERNDRGKPASREWNTVNRNHILLLSEVKDKRNKAVEHLAERLLKKYDIKGEHKARVTEELKLTLFYLFLDMFGGKDMSYIELVVKFQTKYQGKDEDKLMQEVVSRLPSQYRGLKRRADGDSSEIAAKTSRRSPPRNTREDIPRPKLSETVVPEWATGLTPSNVMSVPLAGVNPPLVNMAPGVLPQPVYIQTHVEMPQHAYHHGQPPQFSVDATRPQFSASLMQQQPQFSANQMQLQPQFSANVMQQQPLYSSNPMNLQYESAETSQEPLNEYYNLYLCQDDFEPFSESQAETLKNFLVSQIVQATQSSNGWAPDLTLKGLQSMCRYEVSTKDEISKDWVLNLNFAEFELFNVLVYTKEELWYERAAIWLPGHSRNRNIEPFEKLKMQNKRLEGVNLGKWKFVKKVVTIKGTRLYVDMPPSAARGLEKHKMLLSYELQKVNVFLKAVAVDKDVFDKGLKEASITDPSLLISAAQSSPMPTINTNSEPGVVKIGLNGKKSLTVEQARKIKEVVVYFLFKYLKEDGQSRTDFVKFGFCQPSFLGIVPDNIASKRWLMSRNFGKMSRSNIVVFGGEDDNTKYFKMIVYLPYEYQTNCQMACERLKQSNQGTKGIHFNLWKPTRMLTERNKAVLEVDMDLESVEAISRMNYKMDYVGDHGLKSVQIKSEYSLAKLEEKIRKCRQEQVDTYDVANMDLESDSDNEIIYLG